MTVVRVAESAANPDRSFGVRVAFDDSAEYEATIRDPATPAEERMLAWYFEEHLRFPFLDKDLERQAIEQLAEYGRSLFRQLLAGEASHDYRMLRSRSFDGCRLEITGSATFHLLHWEALRDPDLDAPLAVRLPITRRVQRLPSMFELPPERPSLNILLVTARPFGRGDVGYRTISRPLLDALRQGSLPVTLDLVRPGTWEALRGHLRAQGERHGSGWYQIIHFDLHGGFSDFAGLEEQRESGRYLFGVPVHPFEGSRPFLFFETAAEGKAAPIPASAVASLLAEHRIPVAVLNACQSAMQTGSEASLAQQLVQAGIPVAVGMAYSVTVTAAALAMPVVYDRLSRGADPIAALHAARQALHDDASRQAYFDQQLDLQDWVLPVGFRQQQVQLRLRAMDDAEQAVFFQRQADVGDEPEPEYGFVGRDLDIQAIERRLLTGQNTNELLVQGMAGAGKSTLLRHLAWWWQRTSLVEQVFAFSYEDRAWTASQIIREIRGKLLSPVEQARADTMPAAAQLEKMAQLLRATRHLLILDNAESITATPAAIPHALDPAEQAQLKTLLSRLRGGQSLVLIGSREAEAWLAAESFGENIYPLPGLDPQATSILLDRILHRRQAARWLDEESQRQALDDLVELLGGYPLPMTVVLPVLATTAPSQVLADLKAGSSAADPTERITRAIEYSHGKLDPALQISLLMLAPFAAIIPTGAALGRYRELLLQNKSVQTVCQADLDGAVAEAVRVGLATPHPDLRNVVQVQPVLPFFLRSRLHDRPALWDAAEQAHYELHYELSEQLEGMLQSNDSLHRAGGLAFVRASYSNFTAALGYALRTDQAISSLVGLLVKYMRETHQFASCRKLLAETIAAYPETAGRPPAQAQELCILHDCAGLISVDEKRLEDAKRHYDVALELSQTLGDPLLKASVFASLGMVALEQRQYDVADSYYCKALDIKLAHGGRAVAASTYHQLGLIRQLQQRLAEAEDSYGEALTIYKETNDRHATADVFNQLAQVAALQGKSAEAQHNYQDALTVFLEFNDQAGAAKIYANLGALAMEHGRLAEADARFRSALDIQLVIGDERNAATTYLNLGIIAGLQGRVEEERACHRQALDICVKFDDQIGAASAYCRLGALDERNGRYFEAEAAYRRALQIYLDLDSRDEMPDVYRLLGSLLRKFERYEEAETCFRDALDVCLETGKEDRIAGLCQMLGNVALSQRRYRDAERMFSSALTASIKAGQPVNEATAYQGLGMTARDQRLFDKAETNYRKCLKICAQVGNREIASLVGTQLGVVLAKLGRNAEATPMLIDAAMIYRVDKGTWDIDDVRWLHRELSILGETAFSRIIDGRVPTNMRDEMNAAIKAAQNPEE